MENKPNPAALFGVQMATLTRLIVHLDECGAMNAEAFLAELVQYAPLLPAPARAAQTQLNDNLGKQLVASRARSGRPTGGTH